MSFNNDEDSELGVFCLECGDETFVNPVTGLCLDCDLEVGSDEEEGDDDGEVCVECGDTSRGSSSDAGNEIGDDGLCPECREALGIEED